MPLSRSSSNSIQPIVLLLTFLWAIYTFVWKEHLAPNLQEPKLEISSAIEKTGGTSSTLVRLSIKAKNTGTRPINLLADNWALSKLVRTKPGTETEFLNRLDSFLAEGNDNASIERSSVIRAGAILATGSLEWGLLKPGESSSFSKLIKLPKGTKEIYLSITIPFSPRIQSPSPEPETTRKLSLRWKYDRVDQLIKPFVCPSSQTEPRSANKTSPSCFGHHSKNFALWRKENHIYVASNYESFAVQ